MNYKAFLTELSQRGGYTQGDTRKLFVAIVDRMGQAFEDGDGVSIPNFGSFDVKKRLERIVVNPATKQKMLVPPKLILGFKPSSSVKDKLKNGATNE